MESVKTGGGIFVPKTTSLDDKILDLIKDNYFFIDSKYDSNNGILEKTEEYTMTGILSQNTSEKINPDNTKSNIDSEENIIVIYEDYGNTSNETQDDFVSSKGILMDRDENNMVNLNIDDTNLYDKGKIIKNNTNDILPLMMSTPKSDAMPRNEPKDKERRGQKRKVQLSKQEGNSNGKLSAGCLINNKKIQLIDKKISILDIKYKKS